MAKARKALTVITVLILATVLSGCLAITNPAVANTENYAKSFPIIEKTSVESHTYTFGVTSYTVSAYIKKDASVDSVYNAQKAIIAHRKLKDPDFLLVYHGVSFPLETPEKIVAFLYKTVTPDVISGTITLKPPIPDKLVEKYKYFAIDYREENQQKVLVQAAKLMTFPEVQSGRIIATVAVVGDQYTAIAQVVLSRAKGGL